MDTKEGGERREYVLIDELQKLRRSEFNGVPRNQYKLQLEPVDAGTTVWIKLDEAFIAIDGRHGAL